MLKLISGIAAFVLTFGVSVSLVGLLFGFTGLGTPAIGAGNDRSVSNTITEFLRRDVRNGNLRDLEVVKNLAKLRAYRAELDHERVSITSKAVSKYFKASSSMNDASLPGDLRFAWREHMEAWQAHDELLRAESARLRKVAGCCDDAFFVKERESSREIKETWYQVLRIAERYGADTSGMY